MRLTHPLSGSTTWVEYDGSTVVRKVWNGAADLVELEVNGQADCHGHPSGRSQECRSSVGGPARFPILPGSGSHDSDWCRRYGSCQHRVAQRDVSFEHHRSARLCH